MSTKTILKGMWWIKGNEDEKFTGILTYGSGHVPVLEIFPKEFDWDKQKVPNNSTVYGDLFGESKKIQAVTLLKCTSQNSFGRFTVGAYIYKHEFVYADCVAIGMLLDDDEIAQVQSPQNIHLTCPGLDEYSIAHAVDYVWKEILPKGRAYRVSDIDKIVYTQPEPISIEIDIGTITISLGPSGASRHLSTRYLIAISLGNPTPQAEVNSLVYSQLLSFLSIITGRRAYIETHSVSISSSQTRSGLLSLELNYGHIAYTKRDRKYDIFQSLLLGREENMIKFATLFPKWRENFAFVEDLVYHYYEMVDQPNETNILQAFTHIETYVLERLLKRNKKGMFGILQKVINANADYFQCSNLYARHFPPDRRDHIVNELANFRHNRIHPKSNKECAFSLREVYAYINVILRSVFLKEMEYTYEDIDNDINHWELWRQLDGE
ncbi:MAG: hypothetical protein OXI77_02040 [Chloroflexota bacterium]|nr:hypothetical protein [Chloroflexota bacterium]MDE2908515.1 hypothetical protein [Chloroflexota bacterium]